MLEHEISSRALKAREIPGERIYLRDVSVSDVDSGYHRWMNSADVTRFLESRFTPHSKESLRDYVSQKLASKDDVFLAIVVRDGDRHIGNIKLGPINWIHKFAELGIMIGEKDCWAKGYGAEAIRLLVEYGFSELNLHKVTAGCYGTNIGSIKTFEKAGFEVEGRRKSQFLCEDTYVDYVLLARINPQHSEDR